MWQTGGASPLIVARHHNLKANSQPGANAPSLLREESTPSMETGPDTPLTRLGWKNLQLQRPLAAWACWQHALRIDPDDKAARQALDTFETLEELPSAARAVYRFSNPKDESRRARWNEHLKGQNLEELESAAEAFRWLTVQDPSDTDARLNLALCLAWLGRNSEAIGELDQVVARLAASDQERAADAWTLAEVLRFGAGAEHLADDLRCVWTLEPPHLPEVNLYSRWPNLVEAHVPIDPMTGREALRSGRVFDWLDRPPLGDATNVKPRASAIPRKLATVIDSPGFLRLSSPDPTTFAALDEPSLTAVATALASSRREIVPLPLAWADAALSTFLLPSGLEPAHRDELTRELVELYHENIWIRAPRHGLSGMSPLEASRSAERGDAVLQAKLKGIIRLREQFGNRASHRKLYQGYPFDRLRRRLGLLAPDANPAGLDPADIGSMSEAELTALDAQGLDNHRLVEAVESSAPFLNDLVTAKFASPLIERASENAKDVDPKSLLAPLVRQALRDSDWELADRRLDQALTFYRGRFRRTVLTWKAEVHAGAGRVEEAFAIYRTLLTEANEDVPWIAADGAETLRAHGSHDLAASLLSLAGEPEKSSG